MKRLAPLMIAALLCSGAFIAPARATLIVNTGAGAAKPAVEADTVKKPRRKRETLGPANPADPKPSFFDGPAIGEIVHYTSKYEDTMVNLARSNDIGYVELLAANPGLDPWLPGKDVDMVIPKMHIIPAGAPHEGIVINLPEMRLFYYTRKNARPLSYPIGIGREGLQTPIGETYVRAKVAGPVWRPTPRMRAEDPTLPEEVEQGPDNPMGTHVLYLGWPEYGIHGTNKPYGIGRRSSSGCIRMYPEDIIRLWPMVPQNARVTVVNQPVKAAWIGSQLFVEAHPTMDQADRMENGNPGDPPTYEISDQDMQAVMKAAGDYASAIDWPKFRQIIRERRGYPIAVASRPAPEAAPAVEPAADGGAKKDEPAPSEDAPT